MTKIFGRIVLETQKNILSLLRGYEMVKRSKKSQKSQAKLQDLVVAVLVEDMEQAREYETLLKVNDIPVVIKEHHVDLTDDRNIAVMVPEDFLDEAHVVIESQDAYDDFYDFALEEEEDESGYDGELWDDNF